MDNNQLPERRRANDVEIAELKLQISELKEDVEKLRLDIKDLVAAWNTAQGITSFIKWASGIVIGVGTLVALFGKRML